MTGSKPGRPGVNERDGWSSLYMTDESSRWTAAPIVPKSKRRLASVAVVILTFASAPGSSVGAQQSARSPEGVARGAEQSDEYPTGDAVAVYEAVLDLLYIDGKERPDVILLSDTARRQSGGPCARKCRQVWPHKSKMDTATIQEYAWPSLGTPRITRFAYRIPIELVNTHDFERISHDGRGYLANAPQDRLGPAEVFWTGFKRKYPGAWGHLMLGTVAFDAKHTEALIGVRQACGENCSSFETIFLRRIGGRWRVIERIPEEVRASVTNPGNLRYRGPAGENPRQSQIIALDAAGTPPRPESSDAIKVYSAILDSLYSFHGERPKTLVIMGSHAWAPKGLPKHRSRIDPRVVANYDFFAQVPDAAYRFKYRLPIVWVTQEFPQQLERDGVQLARAAAERMELEQSPIWLAFNAKYPGAWGYLSLGRVSFDPRHTQALVFTQHSCGSSCVTADTWLLERKNESWQIVERMPRDNQSGWALDGLRYLGPDVAPNTYRPRRVQGVVTDAQTSRPLGRLKLAATFHNNQSRTVTTDTHGRYVLNDLPLGGFSLKVPCRTTSPADSLHLGAVSVTPGLDSIINVAVNFSHCPQPEPQLAPNAPQDSPVAAAQECMWREIDAAIKPYVAQARASWPKARERYLAGLPAGHSLFVTVLLTDQSGRREQVFVAVDGIRDGIISGRIWSNIAIVRGYHHGDRYLLPEAKLRDWTISKPDGSEEGNFVGKFLDGYEASGTCAPDTVSE